MPGALLPYLKLIRLPNVFSALADIIAGFFIARFIFLPPTLMTTRVWLDLGLLGAASACLYLSGMAFNDVADFAEDSRIRPERPIPSGGVSRTGAVAVAAVLMLAGLCLASMHSQDSLFIAALLAFAILSYDFVCKKPEASMLLVPGPLALGLCRGCNLLLGLSGSDSLLYKLRTTALPNRFWLPVLASAFFGASVTAFSAQEESGKKASALILGWLCVCASFSAALLAGWRFYSDDPLFTALGILLLTWIAFGLIQKTRELLRNPSPSAARALVLTGLKGYCPLDAALLLIIGGLRGFLPACAVLLLLLPGGWLRKKLSQFEA